MSEQARSSGKHPEGERRDETPRVRLPRLALPEAAQSLAKLTDQPAPIDTRRVNATLARIHELREKAAERRKTLPSGI